MHGFAALALALVLVGTGGCAANRRADRQAFDTGYAAFRAGQWEKAIGGFTQYLRSDPTSPDRGEVYYYRGEALVRLNRRAEAKTDFVRAIGAGARPPIDQFARVAVGNLYYEEGNDLKALEHYGKVLAGSRDGLPMAAILFRAGVSLQRLGRWSMADKYLARVIEDYSNTPWATLAMRRLHADAFRVQTGAFAAMTTAQSQAHRAQRAGFAVRIAKVTTGRQTLHAVQVGRAPTYAGAEALARRVRQAGFEALIVP